MLYQANSCVCCPALVLICMLRCSGCDIAVRNWALGGTALAAIARAEGRTTQILEPEVAVTSGSMRTPVTTEASTTTKTLAARRRYLPSPFQLTRIRDLPPAYNIDTITLSDILGHPLLSEIWQFNYLHSIPFITSHIDADVLPHVSLKIVHGFWRNDDARRQRLISQAEAAKPHVGEVKLVAAHMPEMFGTHHAKMMVLFRRDGVAQLVVHTANMIEQDWTNLTQAVWRSPELPLLGEATAEELTAGLDQGLYTSEELVRVSRRSCFVPIIVIKFYGIQLSC